MTPKLPKDLQEAESQLFSSTYKYLISTNLTRLSIDLRFEGLKVEPIAIRLAKYLKGQGINTMLAFSDFGSSALNKRDNPDFSNSIYTYKDIISSENILSSQTPLIAITPQPYNYQEFYELCAKNQSKIIMLNGKLEDTAVGIGSVGRDRRSAFINSWNVTYWLQTLNNGALLFDIENKWQLFSYSEKGYSLVETFDKRPDEILINTFI